MKQIIVNFEYQKRFIQGVVVLFFIIATANVYSVEKPLERSATNPTAWKWYYNVSAATISAQINNGYRLTDIEVVKTAGYRFNVAMVKNTGIHATNGWWWYYGISAAQLSNYLSTNSARLIDIESYYIGNTRYFAVVMIRNTGIRSSGWYYYYGQTLAGLSAKLTQKNARLIDVDTYVRNSVRYYDAVMVPNTGAHAKSWWWYTNITTTQIRNYLRTNKARLIDIERQSNGRYTVAMLKNNGKQWWWHYGVTSSTVSNFVSQYGARIIDIESYTINGNRRFNVIYLNNVNQQTSRLRDILNASSNGGNYGVYVKRISGSTRAALKSSTPFEPASTIKALHHIHGMKRIYNGLDDLNDWVLGYDKNGTSNQCPTNSFPVWNRRHHAHDEMMKVSDNRWTQALRVNYGENAINNTASALGMTKSSLNHRIGCAGDAVDNPNRLTLVDAGKLYQAVRTGYIGFGATQDSFYDLMSTGKGNITTVIFEEAVKLNFPAIELADFVSLVRVAAKAGKYSLNGEKYRSIAGWVSLPAKYTNGSVYNREYVHGFFIEKASWVSNSFGTWDFRGETMREQISSALLSYKLY